MPEATSKITEASQFHNLAATDLADLHGQLGAEIAALEARRKTIAAELIRRGESSVNGERFTASLVVETMVCNLDRKAIEAEMGEAWLSRFLKWSKRAAGVRTMSRTASNSSLAAAG